jgi:hypothetical protein
MVAPWPRTEDSFASLVTRGASNTSASTTYAASYAVRLSPNPRSLPAAVCVGGASTAFAIDPLMPRGHAVSKFLWIARSAAGLGQPQDRQHAERAEIRRERGFGRRPEVRRGCSAILQSTPKHRRRSPRITLRSHSLRGGFSQGNRLTSSKPHPHLGERRRCCDTTHLAEEVVGEAHAFLRRASFELAVQVVRDVPELNHLGHERMLAACAAHGKQRGYRDTYIFNLPSAVADTASLPLPSAPAV